jgi:hypothetical protein
MDKFKKMPNGMNQGGSFGGVYFMTFIGAAVYFVNNSVGFWGFVVALLKAIVWPAFIVYQALSLLKI